ncbi:DUF4347 domain-containing protein [Microcystis aeruginosa str. Chao 1910]|uniref:DUF4347 domain-containing protein n=1 Tax=Microcystis aeruginosa TaxID=1126 RepID=UPI00224583FD|nr:DUF4347 domain-containing protein [Microcystis aeruginosa]UZO74948.1 DUF4347 domain-containing protein [Microcystis aeruginosa str. Chao 1910]
MTSTLLPILPAVDDILFNFAQSDGLSQVNQVNSARNQRLTATVVFLDAGVTDYQTLQAGVIPGIATVILTPNQDGIEQITAFLQQNPQITTIHLVSHGAPGCLYLGNCQLNLTNIYDYRQQLQNWAKINHILLYGCQVAAGDAGTEFINKLSQVTRAKIAASSRRVGNAALGGSWELEVSFPAIKGENQTFVETLDLSELQTSGVFQLDILNTYQGVFTLSLVGNYDTSGYAYDVQVVGNYAYVADGDSGLQIIDISNPTNPTLKGNYDTTSSFHWAYDVQVVGNYAYVADGDSGLQIIDISNPTNPTLKGNYDTGWAYGVQIVGNYAYIADTYTGLQIIDISNPTNPTFKGNYYTSEAVPAYDVQVVGNYAYIITRSGLQIIDISNPTNPTLNGNYNYGSDDAYGVQIVGNYAYVAHLLGLQIIDISNPSNPTLKGNYDTYFAYGVEIVGNYAYVSNSLNGGLEIIDISNPSNPTLKGNYDTSGQHNTYDVQVVGNYAYVAYGLDGLKIIDVSEFTSPQTVTLSISPSSVTEDGTSNLVYTFTRTGVTTNALTVNYTLGGTATLNTDYTRTGTNNTVTFAAGSSTAKVTIDPTADTTVEPNETVILTLAAGTGYTMGTTTAVTGTITNDDFSQLSINNITVVEGLDNNAILTVTVNNPNPQPISVNYTTAPINATANVDYTSKTGTLTIAPNTSTATISIPILNDNLNEANETFAINLSNPVNATLTNNKGIVTISDTLTANVTTTLPANVENLTLTGSANINGTGNAANNILTGNSGNNILNGSDGNDTLIGGTGNDTITGGAGGDRFTFNNRNEGIDTITDFLSSQGDKITVSAGGFGGGLAAGVAITAAQFVLGTTALNASNRFIYNTITGGLFFDGDGTGTLAAIQIATLSSKPTLTASDILVLV